MKENLMQRKRKYLLMPKKELTERCLLIEEEIERLHSIIKEVREYLPKLRVSPSYELDDKIDNLEEILDKVGGTDVKDCADPGSGA